MTNPFPNIKNSPETMVDVGDKTTYLRDHFEGV